MSKDVSKLSATEFVTKLVVGIIFQMLCSWALLALIACKTDITYTFGSVVWLACFATMVRAVFFIPKLS